MIARQNLWRLFWIGLSLFFLVFCLARAWNGELTDANAYYHAGIRALHGENLYIADEGWPFKYLPPVAYLFVPFALLSFQWARVGIMLVTFGIHGWIYAQAMSQLGNLGALLLLLSCLRFHNVDILNLQINSWVLACFFLYWKWKNKKPNVASSSLALAVCFKVLPIFLVSVPLVQKNWKMVGRVLVFLGVICSLPILFSSRGINSFYEWYYLLKITTPWPAPTDPSLQSIPAAIWYHFRDWLNETGFTLGIRAVLLGMLAFTVYPVFVQKKFKREFDVYAALLALTVLFSPLAWKHHYILFLPSYWVLIDQKKWIQLGTVVFLMSIASTLFKAFERFYLQDWGNTSFITVIGGLLCWYFLVKNYRKA